MNKLLLILLLINSTIVFSTVHTEVTEQPGDGYVDIWIPLVSDTSIEELFEEYSVRVTLIPQSDFRNKLEFAYKNGLLPDLTFVDYKLMEIVMRGGVLQPIDSFIDGLDGLYRSSIIEGAIESCSFKGQLYGLPVSMETEVMYYNKTLLPQAPVTLAELITAGEILFQEDGISIGVFDNSLFNNYLQQNNPETPEELNSVLQELFLQFLTIYNSSDRDRLHRENSFERGLVATKIADRSYRLKLDRYFPELNYGMTVIPAISEESSSNSTIHGINVVMNPYSEDLDKAWKVMKFLTNTVEGNSAIAQYFDQLPTLISAADRVEEFSVFVNQAKSVTKRSDFDFSKLLESLYRGELTPEEAANLIAPIPEEPESL